MLPRVPGQTANLFMTHLRSLNRLSAAAIHLGISAAAAKAQPLAKLAQRFLEARAAIAALAGTAGIAEQDLGYLPLIGRAADLAVIVDRRNGNVLGTLPFDPW